MNKERTKRSDIEIFDLPRYHPVPEKRPDLPAQLREHSWRKTAGSPRSKNLGTSGTRRSWHPGPIQTLLGRSGQTAGAHACTRVEQQEAPQNGFGDLALANELEKRFRDRYRFCVPRKSVNWSKISGEPDGRLTMSAVPIESYHPSGAHEASEQAPERIWISPRG